jgi:hypothetical protein
MDFDEYSTSRVPPERSMSWWRIAVINVLFSVSLPTLITGMDLANESSQAVFLSSILIGSLIRHGLQDLGVERGDHVPGVPRYQFSTALDYSHPVSESLRGRWDLNGQWVGPSQGTIIHSDPDFSRPAYFVMGGNVGLQWPRFDLSLFVTNLLDQHKVLQRPNIALVEYGVTVRPRTVGLSGNYSF